ncbi:MAG: SDR family NAD(P)-dependent oxidoreductase [Hyphomicrobiaceae bacterium]
MTEKEHRPVAVVTGSTSGIGLAIAQMLIDSDHIVVLNSARSQEKGRELERTLPGSRYIRADVSSQEEADRVVREVLQEFGRIDVLVNNVGRTVTVPHRDLAAVDRAAFMGILETNLMSAWLMSRAATPALSASGGNIIIVSSLAGVRPRGSSIPYAVSKAALNHMTLMLAKALAPEIRVNAVAPGLIDTPFTADMPDMYEEWAKRAPLKTHGSPRDVAQACRYLLSASFVTGEVLKVDGGMHLM